jgi:hypothetical protein
MTFDFNIEVMGELVEHILMIRLVFANQEI